MTPHYAYVQNLVGQYQTAWHKARKEDRKFLRRLQVTPDVIEKIMRRCTDATETDGWQPKPAQLKSHDEESVPESIIRLSPLLSAHGNTENAALVSDSTRENPSENQKGVQAYRASGDAHRMKLEQDLAIADYTKAIKMAPEFAPAYCDRARAYMAKAEHDLAILDFTKAIELYPKYAEAYKNRGNAYATKGKLAKAIADYNKAIELDPKYAEVFNNRGTVYAEKREIDEAIKDYTKALELDPKLVRAMVNLGHSYEMKKDKEKAVHWYEQALKHKNQMPDKGKRVQKRLKELNNQ